MPRVTQLRIGTGADVHATGAIGGLLVDAWAGQLRRVDCPVPVALAGCALSSALTHLSIALGAGPAARLPRVCAASLRVLHLDEVPPGFSWADVFNSGDAHSAAVCFASLAELRLRYRRTNMPKVCAPLATAPDTDMVKLCFPQLRRCHIDGALGVVAQLPPAVDCLSLTGPPEAALALGAAGVERTGALRLCVGLPGGRSDMDAFCAATNYWFGRVAVRGEATLELHQCRAPLDAQLLAWPQMTRLSIHGPCEFGTVAGIIQRAEALRRLEVYELSMEHLLTDVAVSGLDGAVRLPLRSSIETLTLYSDADEPCLPATADTIQDLLLRLRRLTRANLSAAFGVHAADLRRGFGHQYPHVEALAIKSY
ncbi:hypothetical protein H4R19_006173 [Coemansia spiralis]|nr:hypothetical protein H4R19_006173 [Coemansia spiralis]